MSIYLVRHANMVKIGFTDDIRGRLSSLNAGSPVPLEFVGWMPGDKAVEAHLHAVFASSRRRGEWFESGALVEQFIAMMLLTEMPKLKPPRSTPTHAASKDEWARYNVILRDAATARWPTDSHRRRQERLVELFLGWSARRVRALYDGDGYGRLMTDERATVDAFARGVDLPGMVRSREGE